MSLFRKSPQPKSETPTPAPEKRLKVGVVGVGSLGQHHARIYSELNTVELVGVFDANAQHAADISRKCRCRAFATLEELASSIEAASLAVPTDRHFAVGSQLMRAGLHLLVEKPIAANTQEAESLVALAREKGLILQVGHIERFNPVMRFLEDHLAKPRFIEAIRLAPFPPPREGALPRGTEVSVVLDLMIHDLDIILHLVRSSVKEIHAVGVPVLSPSEDIANVRLVFENGCVANITASRISRDKMRKIRVFQEDTYVSLDYMNQAGQLLRKTAKGIEADKVPIEKGEPLAAELASFVQCVLTRCEPVVTGKHGSEALKLAVEICLRIRENPS
jgi:predicted dehydrogenase